MSEDSSTSRQLGRRRRGSDIALFFIGISICVLSVFQIVWHNDRLTQMVYHNHQGRLQLKGKSAFKTKLDQFVMNKEDADRYLKNLHDEMEPPENKMKDEPIQMWEMHQQKDDEPQQPPPAEYIQGVQGNSNINIKDEPHPVAHLNCADHGGPNNQQIIDEMVFWSDIPSDASYLSPMHPLNDPFTPDDTERFLTFEPDHGGWNNIRMAMETALVMSHAMGRTLVLPPEQQFYLLGKNAEKHKTSFGFNDFFHLDAISIEHRGFKVITMEEFLVRVAMKGELKELPPMNKTNYGGQNRSGPGQLFKYLRQVGNAPDWDPWKCVLAIPSSTKPEAILELNTTHKAIMNGSYGKPRPKLEEFNGKPTPVNASVAERMREMLADRDGICIYDKPLQESKLIHLKVEKGTRLLTHFYAFIFFADWKQDLWSKRFVRDHLRYVDEIMCAAARVIAAVRNHARKNKNHKASAEEGIYDATHIRRGDFQYPPTQLPADQLFDLSKSHLIEGATLYIATDERDKSFFDIFKKHYDVVFLDDFIKEAIPDVNSNFYGMIDQLVAYKSRTFYGTWWSTLSGYVNRMRGYYITKHKMEGYRDGTMQSWYFVPDIRVEEMRSYIPVRKPIYCREFPVSWRDIDQAVDGLTSN